MFTRKIILISSIVITVLALGGCVLQNKNTNSAVNTNVNTNTSSFIIDTSDWKTYNNTKYTYSIKYPKDFRIEEGDIYINIYSYPEVNAINLGSDVPQNEIKVVVSVYTGLNQTLDNWIESFGFQIEKEESFLIGHNAAKKVWGTETETGNSLDFHSIYYRESDKGIVFTAFPYNSELLNTYYSIVESFKFND